jgi:hypothetical protein
MHTETTPLGRRPSWDHARVSGSPWNDLTPVEYDLMICAIEAWGVLPYACSRHDVTDEQIAEVVLTLVDRGWAHVHRIEEQTAADGSHFFDYSPPIPRDQLDSLLADRSTWGDPIEDGYPGAITLSVTQAWTDEVRRQRA